MAISNTSILIKRSTSNRTPSSLQAGEFAYSYSSNTLFLGTSSGTGIVNVGGLIYTQTIDAATAANTASTLVKRDANQAFFGRLYGNANTATTLEFARNFSVSGGDITASAVSFDGSSAVVLNASLNSVPGLSAGYYGGSTQGTTTIPVVQVSANGRIMAISNTTLTSSFDISDGTTSNTIYAGATVEHIGTTGIVTAVSANTITFSTDETVLRSNTITVGPQVINSDVTFTGNVYVQGNTTQVNTTSMNIADPILYIAANNYSGDIQDIGWAANYFDGTNERHTGIFRDSATKQYYIFDNYLPELSGNNTIDVIESSFRLATVNANVVGPQANVTAATFGTANVTNDLGIGGSVYTLGSQYITDLIKAGSAWVTGVVNIDGATYTKALTAQSLHSNTSLVVDGTTTLTGQANTSADLGVAGNAYFASNVKVTGSTTFTGGITATSINASSLSLTNQLTVPNGGTGVTSFTSGEIIVGNGSGALNTIANTTFAQTGVGASNNTITSVSVDAYGRYTAATYSAISGLTVGQGGTGVNTFTTNGITYGNGTSPMGVTAAAGIADQTWSNQILTVTNAGIPVWSSAMDGGQF